MLLLDDLSTTARFLVQELPNGTGVIVLPALCRWWVSTGLFQSPEPSVQVMVKRLWSSVQLQPNLQTPLKPLPWLLQQSHQATPMPAPNPYGSVSPGSLQPGPDPGGTSWMGLQGCHVPESLQGPCVPLVPLEPSLPALCSILLPILHQNDKQKANDGNQTVHFWRAVSRSLASSSEEDPALARADWG